MHHYRARIPKKLETRNYNSLVQYLDNEKSSMFVERDLRVLNSLKSYPHETDATPTRSIARDNITTELRETLKGKYPRLYDRQIGEAVDVFVCYNLWKTTFIPYDGGSERVGFEYCMFPTFEV